MKILAPRPPKRTVTIQLSDRDTALLDALAAKYGTLSTPTAICHAAMEAGLLRLAASLGLHFDGAWSEEELRRALDPAPAVGLMRTALEKQMRTALEKQSGKR